jgi:hypothetical protein
VERGKPPLKDMKTCWRGFASRWWRRKVYRVPRRWVRERYGRGDLYAQARAVTRGRDGGCVELSKRRGRMCSLHNSRRKTVMVEERGGRKRRG